MQNVSELMELVRLPAHDPGPPYPASKRRFPDEAMARIKLEEYVPGEVLQHIPMDRTTYWA